MWGELKNTARVERWTPSLCYEKDFFTGVLAKESYETWDRKEIAKWENDPHAKDYRWSINTFLTENGVPVKEGKAHKLTKTKPEGVDEPEDPFKVEIQKEGEGDLIVDGKEITIHYEGTLRDSETRFDGSRDQVAPLTYIVGQQQMI